MQGAHHVLHLILPMRHLANDRLSGPFGRVREAIPLPTALHASDVTTILWTLPLQYDPRLPVHYGPPMYLDCDLQI